MFSMFYGCSSLTTLDVSKWVTSNVTNMSYMFNGCIKLITLDVSGFDTRNVTNMNYMLYDCNNLTTIYASDNFVTNQVEDSTNMFGRCSKLIGGNGTTYNSSHTNKEYARIDKEETPGYFTSKESTTTQTQQKALKTNMQEEMSNYIMIKANEHTTITEVENPIQPVAQEETKQEEIEENDLNSKNEENTEVDGETKSTTVTESKNLSVTEGMTLTQTKLETVEDASERQEDII